MVSKATEDDALQTSGKERTRHFQRVLRSGRRDLNSGPLVPQTSALTRLRHAPFAEV
jgi:hypothetical protein